MTKKGMQRKIEILEKANLLFSSKGFTSVTMKDICEITGLSRGGLYRHYGSTREIFKGILDKDRLDSKVSLEAAIEGQVDALVLFNEFLTLEKNKLLDMQLDLTLPIYEFCILYPEEKSYLNERFDEATSILSYLIDYGKNHGTFKSVDSRLVSRHIILFLEGLKLSSRVLEMDEETIDEQLMTIAHILLRRY